jgi:AraC family transcriptional regulator
MLRLPPLRALSPLVARVCSGLVRDQCEGDYAAWEELSIQLAARVIQLGLSGHPSEAPQGAIARVTRVVRNIDSRSAAGLSLGHLAQDANLSPYHFLRTLQR